MLKVSCCFLFCMYQDDVGTEAGGQSRDEPHVLVPREQRGNAASAAPGDDLCGSG